MVETSFTYMARSARLQQKCTIDKKGYFIVIYSADDIHLSPEVDQQHTPSKHGLKSSLKGLLLRGFGVNLLQP